MKLKSYGLLSMVHEARTDLSMWFGLLFLLAPAGPLGRLTRGGSQTPPDQRRR